MCCLEEVRWRGQGATMLGMNGGEVCEELCKRMNDVCCLEEVRWRGQGAMMLGMNGGDIGCGGLKKELVV